MSNEFGKKIKQERLHLDLSLRKVCEAVFSDKKKPISVSYLNDIEQGYRNPPDSKIIVQLAKVLKLEPQDLLNLAGKVHPIIEDVSKKTEVGVLFRKIAEHIERDPGFAAKIQEQLDKNKDDQK
ncbi:hypothetical protein BU251_02615 [Candidatus Velamenicoccus archaeovorus]|uniref:HTH cro/C1-type domain-containing protein n=1 Tax=Velamenicoccus archaeovorus TaxID=1930593 RepID=A0A410P3J7_VELA1|nr:helix-turn-helix transcriptional regulator [Candidatus Velamenicoccus archaeovorus]QAT16700.1 hypothetical protein BU251_02615 [Candidatus Velamenicoccus archaeovorus]